MLKSGVQPVLTHGHSDMKTGMPSDVLTIISNAHSYPLALNPDFSVVLLRPLSNDWVAGREGNPASPGKNVLYS